MFEVHYVFHYILSEIGQIYHGEIGQPFTRHELIVTNR